MVSPVHVETTQTAMCESIIINIHHAEGLLAEFSLVFETAVISERMFTLATFLFLTCE